MKRLTLLLVPVVVTGLAACSPAPKDDLPRPGVKPLKVYADSALTETFTQIGKDFEGIQGGVEVEFVFGAGSALEKQLGDADVFASASREHMKFDSKVFAVNRLVLALPQGNPKNVRFADSFHSGPNQASFAMCAAEEPCGTAARAALTNAGIADGGPAPKAVGQDVKQTLAKLTSGEVDSAFVYASDVKATPSLIAVPMRGGAGEPQRFPIAVVSGSPESKRFYDYLFSYPARKVLSDAGFELP